MTYFLKLFQLVILHYKLNILKLIQWLMFGIKVDRMISEFKEYFNNMNILLYKNFNHIKCLLEEKHKLTLLEISIKIH